MVGDCCDYEYYQSDKSVIFVKIPKQKQDKERYEQNSENCKLICCIHKLPLSFNDFYNNSIVLT